MPDISVNTFQLYCTSRVLKSNCVRVFTDWSVFAITGGAVINTNDVNYSIVMWELSHCIGVREGIVNSGFSDK